MQQRGTARVAVVGLGRSRSCSGNDDHQGITAGPPGTINDLLDDRGNVGRALVDAGSTDRIPIGWLDVGFRLWDRLSSRSHDRLESLSHTQNAAPRLFLETADARGLGLAYSFGIADFSGWHTFSVNVHEPYEYWGACKAEGTHGVVPPLQPYRLRLTMSQACRCIDVGLGALTVTGDVRLAPPGITSFYKV